MKYLILSLVWIAYLSLHSGMITITVTDFLKRTLGRSYRFYRLFFVIVAIATLVPVLWYSNQVKEPAFFTWEGYLALLNWLILATGFGLFAAGAVQYNFFEFFGIDQIRERVKKNHRLNARGILGVIRHPYYTGTILLFWAGDLDYTSLIINSIVTAYVIIGTYLEERKLILEFGDAYREYRQRVSMFVPWKWLLARLMKHAAPAV